MISINNLSVYMKKDMSTLIKDFSLVICENDKIAITGDIGTGKSTLLKAVYDMRKISDYALCDGSIEKRGSFLGYMSQDMNPMHYEKNVNAFLDCLNIYHKLNIGKTVKMAMELGMNTKYVNPYKIMKTFSGGEKVKIRLVLMASMLPDILLMDEPSNDIDAKMLEWLKVFILKCHSPILYITSNENLINNIATKIVYFEKNKLDTDSKSKVSVLTCDEYAAMREKEYEESNNSKREIYRFRDFSDKSHMQCLDKDNTVISIDIDQLKSGSRLLSEQLQLNVKKGQHIGIYGNNGLGKTVFLEKIYENRDSSISTGYIAQDNIEFSNMGKSCIEYLTPSINENDRNKALKCLLDIGFEINDTQNSVMYLSDGQKTLLKIAKVMFDACEILLMDEPIRNLSASSREMVIDLFKNFNGTIIAVSNDERFLDQVCDEIYEFTKKGLLKNI
ncbi:MAG: ATP-binding cassette domain-containing protein [Clostridia bacterium]